MNEAHVFSVSNGDPTEQVQISPDNCLKKKSLESNGMCKDLQEAVLNIRDEINYIQSP
jgi:hypothetical protein